MISSYHFGRMTVKGHVYRNDLKILGDEVVPDWWRREGHALYAEDIADILYGNAETLVVGTGAYGGMKVTDEAATALESRGVEMVALPTKEAVAMFNSLHAQGKEIAGAFHLTC